jgi:hypothetical protein
VSKWSLLLDAKILARTVPVVILGKGGHVDGILAALDIGDHSEFQLSPVNRAPTGKTEFGPSGAASQSHSQDGPIATVVNRAVDISATAADEEGR